MNGPRALILSSVLAIAAGTELIAERQGARHPAVAWDESSNSAVYSSCLECHADKNNGTSVHAAVAIGCEACHTVDRYRDDYEIYLVERGNTLCFVCHSDKQPQEAQVSVHQPVRKDACTDCHDPHSSSNAYLLKKPTEGMASAGNLCLTCHTNIVAQVAKPVQHAAIEMGCSTCHITHKSEPSQDQEGIYHLTRGAPGLCLDCHDASAGQIRKSHQGQPFEKANCAECHNPHGSDSPKLMNTYVHAAFLAGCETCHMESADGQVRLQEGARRTLCLVCHAHLEQQIAAGAVKHTPAEMEDGCVSCHSPHATAYAKQLRQGPVRTCLQCHPDLAEARANKEFLHRPVFEQGCAVCHQPHAAEEAKLLRAAVPDLCLECHDSRMAVTARRAADFKEPVKLFNGIVVVESAGLQNLPTIRLLANREQGHPILSRHPVRGKYPGGEDMTCLTCHLPHAANGSEKLYVTEKADQRELCRKCHS